MIETTKKRRGISKVGVLVGAIALGAIAFGAYKILFNRTGEAAIQLIPADARLVVTLDTAERQPTPEETFVWVVTRTDMRWVRQQDEILDVQNS